jgi:hypothetical protein
VYIFIAMIHTLYPPSAAWGRARRGRGHGDPVEGCRGPGRERGEPYARRETWRGPGRGGPEARRGARRGGTGRGCGYGEPAACARRGTGRGTSVGSLSSRTRAAWERMSRARVWAGALAENG